MPVSVAKACFLHFTTVPERTLPFCAIVLPLYVIAFGRVTETGEPTLNSSEFIGADKTAAAVTPAGNVTTT